ncbi:MAG TPA: VCBS repeat-containing protein [Flavisolibacter sp.]|nr:VCBS repeat-containing protein [Flavisolibacter sp.]
MMTTKTYQIVFCLTLLIVFSTGCQEKKVVNPLFIVRDHKKTGLDFVNKLTPTADFNMFRYMYFYNGAGIGAGDFNNDGLIDLFFAANQSNNKLYVNKGQLKFVDVTTASRIPQRSGWSTGVSVVDINNDGLLDIYISKVGNFESLKGRNQLLVCKGIDKGGIPFYEDEATKYGLDFSGFGTHAAFFDFDMDGDLDCFLLNHSVHQNGTFAERKRFLGTYHPLSGDRIFRNDNSRFTDVTKETGIHSSAISYGLGIAVSDIDLDGFPDMYVGNDFHENDYLYINQKNGTFKDAITESTMHTSQFSMGVDVADVNNDAHPEIISMDMLPSDPYILKRSLGEDEFNTFQMKVRYGYNHQYARNNLQWNRGNGHFSEVGLYSGVAATDWSWAPLWMDFDNDGLKDLFVSNGIPKRLNDIDYVNYVSNTEIQQKIRDGKMAESDMQLIDKFPQIKLPNKFYKNKGQFAFTDMEEYIDSDASTFSNGSIYADLDNDGDLDIVVNNIDDPVLVYENTTNDKNNKHYLSLKLKGPANNINALGAKVVVYAGTEIQTYEKYPVKGFLSSMEVPLHIGLSNNKIDSILLVWPDITYQPIDGLKDTLVTISYKKNLPVFNYVEHFRSKPANTLAMEDITSYVGLKYRHIENDFVEFDREPLIPFMVSKEGPGIAVGDINNDGLDDLFLGASKREKAAVFIQNPDRQFIQLSQPDLERDSTYEDVSACWLDVNKDTFLDLVIASGGNEYYGKSEYLMPRVYLNDKNGKLKRHIAAFENLYVTASCLLPIDFNGDGAMDLFLGGRAVPWEYGQVPTSYLLQNDGAGRFKDVTSLYAKELAHVGFVKNGQLSDLNKDGQQDLILATEWGGIYAFLSDNGRLRKKVLTEKTGWWNFVLPVDVDNDGDLDLLAGNQGLNCRLKPTAEEPVRMYYNDFDNNGKKEQIITYYINGKELPFANKDELQKQIPVIKKRFLYAEDFAKADLKDILSSEKLENASLLSAEYFASSILINDGQMNFTVQALPWEAQITPYKDAVVVNANGDAYPDFLMFGNFYESNIQMGRNDADYGTLLINYGNGTYACKSIKELCVKGQVRNIRKIKVGHKNAFVLARNNDSAMVVSFKDSPTQLAFKE